MSTVTKRELIDRIAGETHLSRVEVKATIQSFLDQVISELSRGNRLELRDFGVFEIKQRAGRTGQNPRTLQPVSIPAKRVVKFKVSRLLQQSLENSPTAAAPESNRRTPKSTKRKPE